MCRLTRCENIVQESVFTPFDLLILAQRLRDHGHTVTFVDANAENLSYPQLSNYFTWIQPDVTIFHMSQECPEHDLYTGRLAKIHGSQSVAINWTFRTMAHEIYPDIAESVDCFAVNHHYLVAIPERLNDLPQILDGEPSMNFGALPFPSWEDIPDFRRYYTRVKRISPYAVTCSTWGCPMGCLFCNYRRTSTSFREPCDVAAEMEILMNRGVKYIHFYDATFNLSPERVYAICDEIERHNVSVKWFINARTDRWTYDLAKRCRSVGLDGVSFGVESFSQDILDLTNKGVTVEQNVAAIEATQRAGVKTNLSMMIGFPTETEHHYAVLVKYLKHLSPNGFFISPYGMCALPNTYWFERDRNDGRDFGDWRSLHEWGKWGSFGSYSSDDLQRIRKQVYRDVLWSRPYLLSNLRWMLSHPSDLRIGVEYLIYSMLKHVKGWRYFR